MMFTIRQTFYVDQICDMSKITWRISFQLVGETNTDILTKTPYPTILRYLLIFTAKYSLKRIFHAITHVAIKTFDPVRSNHCVLHDVIVIHWEFCLHGKIHILFISFQAIAQNCFKTTTYVHCPALEMYILTRACQSIRKISYKHWVFWPGTCRSTSHLSAVVSWRLEYII